MKATACPQIAHRLIDSTLARFDSNRPTRPSYAEQEPPKQPSGRGRGKRKRDEEKQEPPAVEEGAKSPGRKAAASKAEVGERKPMLPVVAAVPVSCTGVALAAVEDDGTRNGKSAKLRVKDTLRAFNSHYLHFVQEEQKRAQAALQEIESKGGLKRQAKGGKKKGGGVT